MTRVLYAVLASLCLLLGTSAAQELRIAAAADLQAALPTIANQFEGECHCKLVISYGSSGNFYQQLQNGAPFDVFLSADTQYPQKLQDASLTIPGTLSEYATGKIVLWVRNDLKLDVSSGLKALTSPAVKKVSIANPQHAPYGRAAEAALNAEGVHRQVAPKLVLGENISQAALFAQSGNADAGIIALSLALNPTMKSSGHFVEIPTAEYPAIRQAVVVLTTSQNVELASRFAQYLSSAAARPILQQYGFSTP
jgi:molybdate transport system substrate-binding protein